MTHVPNHKEENKTNVTTNVLGASGTDTSQLVGGALPNVTNPSIIAQARSLADAVYGKTDTKPNMALASLLYFSKLAEESSKPGATLLGSAGTAFQSPAAYLLQEKESQRKQDQAKASLVAGLVPTLAKVTPAKKADFYQLQNDVGNLKKGQVVNYTPTEFGKLSENIRSNLLPYEPPKAGKSSVIDMGPVMENGKPKLNADGLAIHKFDVQDASGKVTSTYEATKSGGININMGDKKIGEEFGKALAKSSVEEFTKFREASKDAIVNRTTVDDLLTMLLNPDLQTGRFEALLLPLKEMGLSLGFDVDVGEIASAQAFRAKTFEIVLGNVSKMKGALSDKELSFLQNMSASLSSSKAGNKLLLLTTRLTLDKAAAFNQFALDWQNENTKDDTGKVRGIESSIQYQEMLQDFQNSELAKENPYDYVMRLADQEEQRLILNYGGQLDDDNLYVEGSLTPELEKKIAQELEDKFSLSIMAKTFKNYFRTGESPYGTIKKKKDK